MQSRSWRSFSPEVEPSSISGTRADPKIQFNLLGVAIGLVTGLANLIWAVKLVTYTRWMAGRIPDHALVRRCERIMPLVGVVYVFTCIYQLVGIAGLQWAMLKSGLGPMFMLLIGGLMIVLPIAAFVALWKMLNHMKRPLDILARA